jgi:hypothetical protein
MLRNCFNSLFILNILAEQQLVALQSNIPDFANSLLSLVKPSVLAQCSLPGHVDFPAVLLLKNLIKQQWMVIFYFLEVFLKKLC